MFKFGYLFISSILVDVFGTPLRRSNQSDGGEEQKYQTSSYRSIGLQYMHRRGPEMAARGRGESARSYS